LIFSAPRGARASPFGLQRYTPPSMIGPGPIIDW